MFRDRCIHRRILPDIQRRMANPSLNDLKEGGTEQALPHSFYTVSVILTSRLDQDSAKTQQMTM